jgi:lysophospholipid acyltransferase (LPLAT)-like uncharacterized protein
LNDDVTQSEPWLKRTAFWLAGQAFRQALQVAPRSQNLRILDLSAGHCPPLQPLARPAILIMWHESIFLPIGLGFQSPVALLVSQHRDANWLTMAAAGMGFDVVRGSTTRGGGAALRKLKELSRSHSMVITPDGPTGPRRTMNMGAVYLASLLQMPLIPVGVGLRNPWRLKTWDRFAVPKLGHRARIIFGAPIELPRRCERETLEAYSQAIGQDLNHLNEVAEQWAAANYEFPTLHRLNLWGRWIPAEEAGPPQPLPALNQHVQTLSASLASDNRPSSEPPNATWDRHTV